MAYGMQRSNDTHVMSAGICAFDSAINNLSMGVPLHTMSLPTTNIEKEIQVVQVTTTTTTVTMMLEIILIVIIMLEIILIVTIMLEIILIITIMLEIIILYNELALDHIQRS